MRLETNLLASLYAYVDAEYPRETEKNERERQRRRERGRRASATDSFIDSCAAGATARNVTDDRCSRFELDSGAIREASFGPVDERNETKDSTSGRVVNYRATKSLLRRRKGRKRRRCTGGTRRTDEVRSRGVPADRKRDNATRRHFKITERVSVIKGHLVVDALSAAVFTCHI